jgi:enoyl-CoA hydratase/carnithine racemase
MITKYFKNQIIHNALVVHFDVPQTANAFGIEEAKEFKKLADYAVQRKLLGFLLTSDQSVFCSGGHLKNYAKLKKKEGLKVNKDICKILDQFQHLPLHTFALVTGDCFGGGIEVLSAFDHIYATPNVLFGMWQRKMGLTWGWGGANRLKYRISKKKLLKLLLEARTLSAYEAHSVGIVDKIYSKELIVLKALESLKVAASLPQEPFLAAKKLNLSKLSPKVESQLFSEVWFNKSHQKLLHNRVDKS